MDKNEMKNDKRNQSDGEEEVKEIPGFTKKELQAALTAPKKEKQETATESDQKTMRQIFNEVPRQKECTSEAWRSKRKEVIYKNYRLISVLPALHKLFSSLL